MTPAPRRIAVEAGHLALPDGRLEAGLGLLVVDGVIRAVDTLGALAGVEVDLRVGDARCLALPGLVNAHQHGRGASTVALGVADAPLERWLVGLLALPPADPRADTVAFCRRAAAAGVTVAAHSHTTAATTGEGYEAELRAILAGYREGGVRGVVAADTRDRGVPVYGDEAAFWSGLSEGARRWRDRHAAAPPPLAERLEVVAALRAEARAGRLGDVEVVLGPPGAPWCSDAALRAVARAAGDEVPVHTHLHETRVEAGFGLWAYGDGTLAALARFGLLGPRLSVAHAVHVTADDRERLAAAGSSVVTNPGSNLRLHAGVAPVRELLEAGVGLAIGTDNMALGDDEQLLDELRLLRALHRRPGLEDGGLGARELLAIATTGGARALAQDDVGALRPGARADVVLVEQQAGRADPLELALATARPADLRLVLAGGRVLAERGVPAVPPASAEVDAEPPPPDLERVIAELDARAVPHYRALEELLP